MIPHRQSVTRDLSGIRQPGAPHDADIGKARLRSRINESLYTVGRELGLDVAGEELAGFVILLQHGIKVCERESSDEEVGSFAGAEFGNRTHFLLQVIQFWNPRRRGPDRFVHLLDVIHEVHVVGATENHHASRGRYSFEDLVHTVDRKADVVVRHQKESRNVAAPLERQLRWQNPRPWIRTSAGRKRHNRPDLMHHVRRGKRCPAAEAVPYDSNRRGFELRLGQDILEKKANVRNAACNGSFGSRSPLLRSFTVSMSEFWYDEFGVIQSGDDVAMAGQVIRQECVASPTAAAARMREKDYRANSNRFRWTPNVAREAPVAGNVERLHASLVNSKSARDKWVVCHAVNDNRVPFTLPDIS